MSLKSSEKIDVNTQELTFEISADVFEDAVEKTYQKQKKNITLQGFRRARLPGKW